MAASSTILLNHNLKRCICTTMKNFQKYAAREGRFMKKMLGSEKRKWHVGKVRISSPLAAERITSNHVTRRMTVLNDLFMQHITDLMATGEASSELLGRHIEVSRVKVTPDFTMVLVYWFSKLEGQVVETEQVLNDCAYHIRHELTQLRVIGQVPLIKFVKDRQLTCLDELEKRLKIADYGEDHVPIISNCETTPELTLTTNLPPKVREQILQLKDTEVTEDAEDETGTQFDVELPPMRHDVLGLDHYAIMTRVKQSLETSREGAKKRLCNVFSFTPNEAGFTPDAFTFQTTTSYESTAFKDFLNKRQIEERQKLRRESRDIASSLNVKLNDYEEEDDDELVPDERDDDILEDVNLESLK